MILLTGFGPFGDVIDNPSAALVRAVHGLAAGGHCLEALVLPVRWGEASRRTIDAARRGRPHLVIGFGVATERARPEVEVVARAAREGADAYGVVPDGPFTAAPERSPTLDPVRLADALGAGLSHDAGRYLCNAWLYEVPAAVPCPAAFVHVPAAGLPTAVLLAALERLTGPRAG